MGPREVGISDPIEPVIMEVRLPAGVAGPEAFEFDVRCFLVPHASGIVLVDTAVPGSAALIEAALLRLGADWTDITDVVLTHHHPDHTGGLSDVIERAGQAAVWAGPQDEALVPSKGTKRPLTEGVRVGSLRVLETPGHTPGHRSFIEEDASIIIAGDAVGSMDSALTRGPTAFTADPDLAEDSLRRLAGLTADRVVFSHGPEVEGPIAAIRRLVHDRRPSA